MPHVLLKRPVEYETITAVRARGVGTTPAAHADAAIAHASREACLNRLPAGNSVALRCAGIHNGMVSTHRMAGESGLAGVAGVRPAARPSKVKTDDR